jgi:hypothetical protein
LSPSDYSEKLDSLKQTGPVKQLKEAQSKATKATQKLNEPVNNIESKVNEKLSLMNKEGGAGANLPSNVNVPDASLNAKTVLQDKVELPKTDLNVDIPLKQIDNPVKDQMGELGGKVNELKGIPQEQIGKVKFIDEIKGAQDQLGKANAITDKAQSYGDDVKNLAQGNLGEVKEMPKALEDKVGKLEEVQGIQKRSGSIRSV